MAIAAPAAVPGSRSRLRRAQWQCRVPARILGRLCGARGGEPQAQTARVELGPGRSRHGCRWSGRASVAVRDVPRGEGEHGPQDAGGESRSADEAGNDEGVGDLVANAGGQDGGQVVHDRPQAAGAAGSASKASAARSPKKAPTAPAKTTKAPAKRSASAAGNRAAAARTTPTKKTQPVKGSPNKVAARSASATATKRATKAPTRAAASAPVAIAVPRDSEWTARELAQVRSQLVAQLSEMQSEYDQSLLDLDELQSSSTDGAGDDQADAGSKTFEREQELSIAANRLDLLTQIKRAVERIDAGTYGYCESCGKPIPKARLKAFPMATLDVACKQREERR